MPTVDDARLALHDCRESKREVVVDGVGDQKPLPWVLSGLLVGLVAPFVWIVASRCPTRKRVKFGFAPAENNDESRKSISRKVAFSQRGRGGLVA